MNNSTEQNQPPKSIEIRIDRYFQSFYWEVYFDGEQAGSSLLIDLDFASEETAIRAANAALSGLFEHKDSMYFFKWKLAWLTPTTKTT